MSDKQLTLGSLFDGSGGFPLGGMLAGVLPVWASEIEPFAIRVTTKRMHSTRARTRSSRPRLKRNANPRSWRKAPAR